MLLLILALPISTNAAELPPTAPDQVSAPATEEASLAALEAALADTPEDAELHYRAGVSYLAAGECTYALYHFSRVIAEGELKAASQAGSDDARAVCSHIRYRLKKPGHVERVLVQYRRIDRGAPATWTLEQEESGAEVDLFLSPGTWEIDFFDAARRDDGVAATYRLKTTRRTNTFLDVVVPSSPSEKGLIAGGLSTLLLGFAVGGPVYVVGKQRYDNVDCDRATETCRAKESQLLHMAVAGWGITLGGVGAFSGFLASFGGRRAAYAALAAGGAFSLAGAFWTGFNSHALSQWRNGIGTAPSDLPHLAGSGFLGLGVGLLTASTAVLLASRRYRSSYRNLNVAGVAIPQYMGLSVNGRF